MFVRLIFFIYSVVYFSGCSDKQSSIPADRILATVGPSVITIQEFIRRSEYTIRPKYCRNSNYIHKKIVLNSLIAEKLTALEYQKKYNGKHGVDNLENFLTGRKEQAMRQVHYAKQFHANTKIKDSDLKAAYKLAGRTISVQFLNLPDTNITKKVKYLYDSGVTLDSVHQILWGGNAPERQISWFDKEQIDIHKSLFNDSIKKGQLIGPIKTNDETYILMAINGWKDEIFFTQSDKSRLWQDTKERLIDQKAKSIYYEWVGEVMKDKQMNLNPEVFKEYAKHASAYFFKMDSIKRGTLNNAVWDTPELLDQPTFIFDDSNLNLNPNDILFNYNGSDWTINDLNQQLKVRPLTFRKRKMSKSEFSNQLRYAIADFLRDIEITKKCYQLGYDNHWIVNSNVDMWRDASLSRRFTSKLRSSDNTFKDEDKWLSFINPIVDTLQNDYSDQIKINMELFEKIELTQTDMVVNQRGVPFPIVVPSFPIITSDNLLNYGSKIGL